jgi:hypothetical protein
MASVFMSFVHEEESTATAVRTFLKEIFGGSIDTFQSSDQSAIYAGEDWMIRIFAELKDAKILLSMLSPLSVTRPWINFEAGAAWMRESKVIPICFGGLTLAGLPKPYSSLQGVEITTREGAHYLVSSIAHHLELTIPRKPFFGPRAALALASPDPEEEKRLIGPYNRLLSDLDIEIPS